MQNRQEQTTFLNTYVNIEEQKDFQASFFNYDQSLCETHFVVFIYLVFGTGSIRPYIHDIHMKEGVTYILVRYHLPDHAVVTMDINYQITAIAFPRYFWSTSVNVEVTRIHA